MKFNNYEKKGKFEKWKRWPGVLFVVRLTCSTVAAIHAETPNGSLDVTY